MSSLRARRPCQQILKLTLKVSQLKEQVANAVGLQKSLLESDLSTARRELKETIAKCETAKLQLQTSMEKAELVTKEVSSMRRIKLLIIVSFVIVGATLLIGGKKMMQGTRL
jgi:hypothetical protein